MSAPDLKTAYRRIMDDHFPDRMEISFIGPDGRQTLVYEKATLGHRRRGEGPALRGEPRAGGRPLPPGERQPRRSGGAAMIAPGRYLASDIELLQSGQAPREDQHHRRRQRAEHPPLLRDSPCAVIVKHNNPCGAAKGVTLAEAYRQGAHGRPARGVRRRHRSQPRGGPRNGRADRARPTPRSWWPPSSPPASWRSSHSGRTSASCGLREHGRASSPSSAPRSSTSRASSTAAWWCRPPSCREHSPPQTSCPAAAVWKGTEYPSNAPRRRGVR